jgi:hypothetical protein
MQDAGRTDGEAAHARGRSRSRSRRRGDSSSSSRSRSKRRHKHKHKHGHKHKHHKSSSKHKHKSRGRSRSLSGDERALVASAQRFLREQPSAPAAALVPPATASVACFVPEDAHADKARRKAEQKKQLAADRERLEELVPRATGKEARTAERVARRQLEKERETSPDVATLAGGGDVMGGSDSFAAAVARQRAIEAAKKQRLAPREAEKAERFSAYAAAEADKMAAFRALLPGGGGPLAIPKR